MNTDDPHFVQMTDKECGEFMDDMAEWAVENAEFLRSIDRKKDQCEQLHIPTSLS